MLLRVSTEYSVNVFCGVIDDVIIINYTSNVHWVFI